MLERFRLAWRRFMTPPARLLLRLGVSPDAVTVVGTAGVCFGALWFFPRGQLWVGVVVVTAFVFSDIVDGQMARLSERSSPFGAFLDSTMDRLGDAAVFGGLVLYFVGPGESDLFAALALFCLVMGAMTSYIRARAEALGMQAKGGIAERADRLVAILVMTFFADLLGLPVLIPVALGVLALASTATVVHRIRAVRRQATAAA